MTFDPKCFDLARSFLSDNPELDAEKLAPFLAARIQETIDEYIENIAKVRAAFEYAGAMFNARR